MLVAEAWTSSPEEAGRIGGAVRACWQQPYGRPLLLAVGLTLVAFGVYELAAARYRPAPGNGLTTPDPRMSKAGSIAVRVPTRLGSTSTRAHDRPFLARAGERTRTSIAVLVAVMLGVYGLTCALGLLRVHGPVPDFVNRWDIGISEWFYQDRTPTLDWLTHYGSLLADTTTCLAVATLAVIVLRLWLGRWRESLAVVVAILGELLIFLAVTATVQRDRPTVPHLDLAPPTSSFPSGHMGAAIALYGCLAVIMLRHVSPRLVAVALAAVGFAIPIVVGLSRIYRGMHYLTDVLAAVLASGMWLTFVILVLLPARPRTAAEGKDRPDVVPPAS